MNKTAKLIIVIVLIAAIAGVAMVKKTQKSAIAPVADVNKPAATIQGNLPRLVDLGADKCIPCKMMAPILEELKTKYNGKLQVDFIDVWKNPGEAPKYKISVIPTQIFYDSSGKELFRHEGFFAKEDILAKWKEFGVDLSGTK
jgi:thioredoxin 1